MMVKFTEFGKKLLNLCGSEEEFVEMYRLHFNDFAKIIRELSIQLKAQIDMTLDDDGSDEIVEKISKQLWREKHA